MELAGHSRIETTLRYAQTSPDQLLRAVASLGQQVSRSATKRFWLTNNFILLYGFPIFRNVEEVAIIGAGNETRTRDFHLGKVENRVFVVQQRLVL